MSCKHSIQYMDKDGCIKCKGDSHPKMSKHHPFIKHLNKLKQKVKKGNDNE